MKMALTGRDLDHCDGSLGDLDKEFGCLIDHRDLDGGDNKEARCCGFWSKIWRALCGLADRLPE